MKHLLPFQLFEAHASGLTPDQEEFLNSFTKKGFLSVKKGTWSVNPETGLVDVSGDFECEKRRLETLLGILFGHVSGNFFCYENQLTSLVGAPQTVDGIFLCNDNLLTALVGAPQKVGEAFFCFGNQLTTLDGAPRTVGGSFYCGSNQLTTLVGAPQTVGVDFLCGNNQLTSLEGAPQTVDGRFSCDAFELKQGNWNPSGWVKILRTGNAEARELILTLPYWDPAYWLELHRSNRRKFNDIWLECRQDPEVRKTALFQEVEAALSGRALQNLDDLQDLKDFGL